MTSPNPPMPARDDEQTLRDEVFAGKTLKQNLQDIVARNNTGYTYAELQDVVKEGEELLEDDELEQVDKTVNLLAHLYIRHAESVRQQVLSEALEAGPPPYQSKTGGYLPRYKRGFNDVTSRWRKALEQLSEQQGGENDSR